MVSLVKYILILVGVVFLLSGADLLMQRSEAAQAPDASSSVKTEVIIAAVGDIMMPISIQGAVAKHKYNYDPLFEKIAPELLSADITFANLETPVDHLSSIAGYPRFNARPELLKALKKAGVGILSVANNHAMDKKTGGLERTLDNIEAAGLQFTGAGRTKVEANKAVQTTHRGITVAFLAYTYGTNERLPKETKDGPAVNILRADSEIDLGRAAGAVRRARRSADLVAVSLHWSDEYRTVPTPWQRRVAAELIESGADAILGHHPHVLQPIESYTARDGRQGLIAFSLGNFISSQNYGVTNKNRANARALRGDGIVLIIHAVKENGRTSIERAEFLPIWTLREKMLKTMIYCPVNLAREISRIEARRERTKEEENTLKLLTFRKKVITDQLTVNHAP